MPHKILILIGSESDRGIFEKALPTFDYFGFEVDLVVSSAHRNPERTTQLTRTAREKGYCSIVCGAGMAAHLAGAAAAHSTLPVIGVPLDASPMGGMDSLLATAQMPAGIPVATLALGKAGAINAAVLSARIISLNDVDMQKRLDEFMAQGARI
jgi:phosphoribosylaminoimidazole carboxylase PurE protein